MREGQPLSRHPRGLRCENPGARATAPPFAQDSWINAPHWAQTHEAPRPQDRGAPNFTTLENLARQAGDAFQLGFDPRFNDRRQILVQPILQHRLQQFADDAFDGLVRRVRDAQRTS